MPDRIAPSPLDVPMYSDNELREACRKATARERQRIRPLQAKWHLDADAIRSSNTEAGAAVRATLRQCAMELTDLLDGDGDA